MANYAVGRVEVNVVPSTKGFQKALKRFFAGLEDYRVDVDADTKAADEALDALARDRDATIEANADTKSAEGQLDRAARDRHATIEADVDTSGARRELDRLRTYMRKHSLGLRIDSSVLGGLTSITGAMTKVGAIAGTATVAVAGVAPAISAVGAAAGRAVGPMAALGAAMAPAALGAVGMQIGAIKAAFSGMGDVIKAANLDEATEAMKDMAPAARDGATALFGLKQEFSEMASAMQSDFWGHFTNLGELSKLMPSLSTAMGRVSAASGDAARNLTAFMTAGVGFDATTRLIDSSATASVRLSEAVAGWGRGIVAAGAAASPVLDRLTAAIGRAANAWGDRMTAGFADGSLTAYFENAARAAAQLGHRLAQIGSIIGGVFKAMSIAGGPAATMLGSLVDRTEQWVNSTHGMDQMVGFFTTMQGAVAALSPVVGRIATIIVTQLAPIMAEFIEHLAPHLEVVLDNLSKTLEAIGPSIPAVAEGFGGLAQLVSQAAVFLSPFVGALLKLSPVLVPLAGALWATVAGFRAFKIVKGVTAAVREWIPTNENASKAASLFKKALGGLRTALTSVSTAIGAAWGKIAAFAGKVGAAAARLGGKMLGVLSKIRLLPGIVGGALKTLGATLMRGFLGAIRVVSVGLRLLWGVMLANPVVAVIAAIAAVGMALYTFFTKTELGRELWGKFTAFLRETWEQVQAAFHESMAFLSAAWQTFWTGLSTKATEAWAAVSTGWTNFWAAVGEYITWGVETIKALWNTFWDGLTAKAVEIWESIKLGWTNFWAAVGEYITWGVETAKALWNTFWDGLKTVATTVWENIKTGWSVFWETLKTLCAAGVAFVQNVWSTAWNAVTTFFATIANKLTTLVTGLWNGIRTAFSNGVNAVLGFVSNLVSRVVDGFHRLKSLAVSAVTSLWSSARSAFSSGVNAVVSFVSSLPGRVFGILSGMAGRMYSIGVQIMAGLRNGVASMASSIVSAVVAPIKRAVSAAKGFLGIHSPSRLMADMGKHVVEGLVMGVDKKAPAAEQSLESLARTVTDAFGKSAAGHRGAGLAAIINARGMKTAATIATRSVSDMAGTVADATGRTASAGFSQMGATAEAVSRRKVAPAMGDVARSAETAGVAVDRTATGVMVPAMRAMSAQAATTGRDMSRAVASDMVPAWRNAGATVESTRRDQFHPAITAMSLLARELGKQLHYSANQVMLPAFTTVGRGVSWAAGTFGPAVNYIGNTWDKLRAATARPVSYAVNTVFNRGIVGMWNSVAAMLGVSKMTPYVTAFARGGYVSGPGGPTDDKIPAFLSNGEYVLRAEAVRSIGTRTLDAVNASPASHRYAGVLGPQQAREVGGDYTFRRAALHRSGGGLAVGTPAWLALKRGYDWARSRNGRPYVWGGSANGAGGTDCSGFMSGIADVILGGSGARQWATMNFPGTQRGAWAPGLAAGFSVGYFNGGPWGGHTAGTIGGVEGMPAVNVESGGINSRVKFGTPDAAGADHRSFTHRWHLIVTDGGMFVGDSGGTGSRIASVTSAITPKTEELKRLALGYTGQGAIAKIPGAVGKSMGSAVKDRVKTLIGQAITTGGAIPAGTGAERWRPMAKRAMARVGFDYNNPAQVNAMIAQIRSESGGNPNIAQQIHDINGTGERAGVGLLQIIPGTFAAYRDPALPNNRRDPYANMVAALRYYKARYGKDLTRMWGHGHGYDSGGWLKPGSGQVFNGHTKPEAVLTPRESAAFVGVATAWADDRRAGATYVGQKVENQYLVDPAEIAWQTQRGVKRAMREESLHV